MGRVGCVPDVDDESKGTVVLLSSVQCIKGSALLNLPQEEHSDLLGNAQIWTRSEQVCIVTDPKVQGANVLLP